MCAGPPLLSIPRRNRMLMLMHGYQSWRHTSRTLYSSAEHQEVHPSKRARSQHFVRHPPSSLEAGLHRHIFLDNEYAARNTLSRFHSSSQESLFLALEGTVMFDVSPAAGFLFATLSESGELCCSADDECYPQRYWLHTLLRANTS
eukprot:3693717-Amphidinium_carterae.3